MENILRNEARRHIILIFVFTPYSQNLLETQLKSGKFKLKQEMLWSHTNKPLMCLERIFKLINKLSLPDERGRNKIQQSLSLFLKALIAAGRLISLLRGNRVFGKSWRLALVKKEDLKTLKILNVKTEDLKIAWIWRMKIWWLSQLSQKIEDLDS